MTTGFDEIETIAAELLSITKSPALRRAIAEWRGATTELHRARNDLEEAAAFDADRDLIYPSAEVRRCRSALEAAEKRADKAAATLSAERSKFRLTIDGRVPVAARRALKAIDGDMARLDLLAGALLAVDASARSAGVVSPIAEPVARLVSGLGLVGRAAREVSN